MKVAWVDYRDKIYDESYSEQSLSAFPQYQDMLEFESLEGEEVSVASGGESRRANAGRFPGPLERGTGQSPA